MLNFFQTIFTKITSAVANVIIAAGLISVPASISQLELPSQNIKPVIEIKQGIQEVEKDNLGVEFKQPKIEITKEKPRVGEIQKKIKTGKNKKINNKEATKEFKNEAEQKRIHETQRLIEQQAEEERRRIEEENLSVQNAQIKIEICKVEAKRDYDNFVTAGKAAINEGFVKCKLDGFDMFQNQIGGISSGSLGSVSDIVVSSCMSSVQRALDSLQFKADEMHNKQYLECLNK